MSANPIRVLLVTHQSQEQSAIPGLVAQLDNREFILAGITGQQPALARLGGRDCDACIIDLPLAEAVALLSKAHQLRIPFLTLLIIVDDVEQDLKAIRSGAAGCLVRANLTVQSLERELLLLTNRTVAVNALQAPSKKSEERYRRIDDEANEMIDATADIRLAEGEAPGVSPGTETVLLVEDDQMVRRMARHILEATGHTVLEAASGHEAMEICRVHDGPVHLLLTDVVMPHMSGPRLSEEVMKIRPGISVLYMSGYMDNTIVDHGVLEEGMHFLQKPFSPDALALKVRKCLDSSDKNSLPAPHSGCPGEDPAFGALRLPENPSSGPRLVNS